MVIENIIKLGQVTATIENDAAYFNVPVYVRRHGIVYRVMFPYLTRDDARRAHNDVKSQLNNGRVCILADLPAEIAAHVGRIR